MKRILWDREAKIQAQYLSSQISTKMVCETQTMNMKFQSAVAKRNE